MWIVISALFAYLGHQLPVTCFVVTVPKATIWIPTNTTPDVVIYQVHVTPSPNSIADESPLFRLQNPSPIFILNENDGTIRINNTISKFLRGKNKRYLQLVVNVFSSLSESLSERDALSKTEILITASKIDCAEPTQNWCFWPSIGLQDSEVFVYENRPPFSPVAIFGPSRVIHKICPDSSLSYRVLRGSEFFTVSHDGLLRTSQSLDREATPILTVQVGCEIKGNEGSTSQFSTNFTLNLLDEDDNGPQLQNPQEDVASFYLDDKLLQEGHVLKLPDSLLIIDKDSTQVNNYRFEIRQPQNMFRVDHRIWPVDTNGSTVIYVKPVAAVSKSNWENPYNMTITVTDVGLLPGNQNDAVQFSVIIYPGSLPKPAGPRPPMGIHLMQVMNATVNKWACKYARVGSLSWQLYDSNDHSYEKEKTIEFSLILDKEHSATPFSITSKQGILYVSDPHYLHSQAVDTYTLEVAWRTSHGNSIVKNSTLLQIFVTDNAVRGNCNDEEFCADHRTAESCQSASGSVASMWNGCSWRNRDNNGTVLSYSSLYSTCSPDLKTCPDGVCDELEEIFWGTCPQDCIERSNLHGMVKNEDNSSRGIKLAIGVCSCDATRACSCGPALGISEPTTNFQLAGTKNPLNSSFFNMPENSGESCDSTCRIVVGTLTIAFLVLPVTVILLWWRRKWSSCKAKSRLVSTGGAVISLSEYVEERMLPSAEADYLRSSELITALMIVDRKWEIPREWLIIEQTLGEGEFGKVMRARVSSVTGISGHRVVAVKMTKKANLNSEKELSLEVQDLLSEFSLLKEVSHPHVIRLLGACTSPGGPFMLVLEYCEHGSLRNYLRRARCVDQDNHGMHRRCAISPRELLSFAWQIAQAMAYLSEVKLVHRDLATRNVLVAADKMCKVSDFGLTRDVYEGDTYLKRSKGRVPVKWMAPESLSDQLYTSKSDVWSFGILLWELATMGANPYPGVTPERLYRLLKMGYRMERPDNCSTEFYGLMVHCWKDDPSERPTFTELVTQLDFMLSAGTDYLDLTSLVVWNPEYFEDSDETMRWDEDDQKPMLESRLRTSETILCENDGRDVSESNQDEELRYLNMKPITKPDFVMKKDLVNDKEYLLPVALEPPTQVHSV